MSQFKITIREQISMWQDLHIWVTANSEDELKKSLKDDSFLMEYEWDDVEGGEVYYETMDNLHYDFSDAKIEEIK
jgi:hypothetical protein